MDPLKFDIDVQYPFSVAVQLMDTRTKIKDFVAKTKTRGWLYGNIGNNDY